MGYFYSMLLVLVDDMEFVYCNLCKLICFLYEVWGVRVIVCNYNLEMCCYNLMEVFGKK